MEGERRSRGSWLTALVLVLVFPVIGFVIGNAVIAKYQNDLVAAIEEQAGRPLTEAERTEFTIQSVCQEPELSGEEVCLDVSLATVTRGVAIGAGVVGVLLLLFVALTAARARQNREALLRLFAPALYLVLIAIAVLVVLDGLLALSSVYLGLGVFLGRIFPIVLLGIGLAVLFGVVGVLRALFSARRRATTSVIARRVDRADEPALHDLIGDIAAQIGTQSPEHVFVGLDPEFYVTEADVQTPEGTWRGRSVYLSLPLTRILSPSELRAILGNEMGHFRGGDTVWSQRFYPVYRGTGQALSGLGQAAAGSAVRTLTLWPAAQILGLFMNGFATAERAISRDRELQADKAAIETASARDIASSLVKLLAFTQAWGQTLDGMVAESAKGSTVPNAGDRFVETVRSSAVPAALNGLDEREIPHPTDSHPPVTKRLEALGLTIDDVAADALVVSPSPSADAVITDRESVEIALTETLEGRIRAYLDRVASAETS
jgi:Zn-dependent protease with chaperone function